jgi:hypothetical protein
VLLFAAYVIVIVAMAVAPGMDLVLG